MPGRYGNIDYSAFTKRGVLLGVCLLVFGALGNFAVANTGVTIPAWEKTLLLDAEWIGVLLILLSPFVFGVFLPLTE